MSRSQGRREREKAWLAILLAWVAGLVDAIGYITLFNLFVAQMSGNTAAVGLFLGQHKLADALIRGTPIPLFVAGVALGAAITGAMERRRLNYSFAITIGVEVALLLAFLLFGSAAFYAGAIHVQPGSWPFFVLVALLTLPMGLQTAALRRVGSQTVHTTYITGMLTKFAEESVNYLFWLRDQRRHHRRLGLVLRLMPRQAAFNRALLLAGIWTSYAIGALWGGYSETVWNLRALIVPLCVLAGIVVLDLFMPINVPSKAATPPD